MQAVSLSRQTWMSPEVPQVQRRASQGWEGGPLRGEVGAEAAGSTRLRRENQLFYFQKCCVPAVKLGHYEKLNYMNLKLNTLH